MNFGIMYNLIINICGVIPETAQEGTMNFETICNLIIAICGVIPTVVSLVVLIVNVIKNKNWTLIVTMIKEAMTTVETYAKEHPEMTSDDKLNMALESVKSACAAAGIKLDTELIKKIIAYINEMCSWSKTVNNNSEEK